MANPNLIELAAEITDYVIKAQFKDVNPNHLTFKDVNGDIRYKPAIQEVFNDHYDNVHGFLESASVRVKDQLETIIPQQTERR